jgi:hypothetical protein
MGGQSFAVTDKMPKEQIIAFIFSRLGTRNAYKLIVDMFITGTNHPDKLLKSYHFKKIEPMEGEIYGK